MESLATSYLEQPLGPLKYLSHSSQDECSIAAKLQPLTSKRPLSTAPVSEHVHILLTLRVVARRNLVRELRWFRGRRIVLHAKSS